MEVTEFTEGERIMIDGKYLIVEAIQPDKITFIRKGWHHTFTIEQLKTYVVEHPEHSLVYAKH